MENRFIETQAKLTDENHVFNLSSQIANRFLGFYSDLAGNILILAAAIFSVYGRGENDFGSAGLVGLALSYVINVWNLKFSSLIVQIISYY